MNKLMARIVAVVLAVMMLGTVSFAASATLNAEKDTITTNATAHQTIKATAGSTIIALYQGASLPETIKINPAKIGSNNTITVEYGGGTGGYVTQEVPVPADAEDEPIEVDVKTTYTTQDGTTYKDVAHVSNSFTVEAGKTATSFGYNITVSGTGFDTPKTKAFTKTQSLSGGGTFKYDIVFLGVPAGVNISAEGFVNYNN